MPDPDDLTPDDSQQSAGVHPPHRVEPQQTDDVYAVAEPVPVTEEVRTGPLPRPSAEPESQPPPPQPAPSLDSLMAPVDRLFSSPLFFRIVARVSVVLAVLLLVGSLLLLWAVGRTWFDGVVMFTLIFVIGEAAAAILERLDRNGP